MARRKKTGNNPKARIAPEGTWHKDRRCVLACEAIYLCSGKHKGRAESKETPPHKATSKCDDKRRIRQNEAKKLLKEGMKAGMMSEPAGPESWPKYVWCVDGDREVYEAKESRNHPGEYHGYRLSEDLKQRDYVLEEWRRRCLTT